MGYFNDVGHMIGREQNSVKIVRYHLSDDDIS